MARSILDEDVSVVASRLADRALPLAGSRVLVTGATGFLGGVVVRVLCELNRSVLADPCRIVAVDNGIVPEADDEIGWVGVERLRADVAEALPIDGPVDYVFHLAGIASPAQYLERPIETIRAAVWGTERLLELSREKRVKKIVFFSSSEIYGNPPSEHIPTPETYLGYVSSLGPRACYDESKRMGETLCAAYVRVHGVPATIVRPFNVYGPGMRLTDRRVIPRFLRSAMSGEALPVYGDGSQTRSYCYVSDAITGCFLALLHGRDGEAYNVGGNAGETSLLELAERIARVAGTCHVERREYPADYPTDEPQRRCPDIRKAALELGYEPLVGLDEGLTRTLNWYRTSDK